MVNRIEVNNRRIQDGKNVAPRDYNMLFTGPPGTGKTSIANEIAPLFNALGITSSKKPPVIVTGDELKSKYVGGSAAQAKEIFERARGGVLFIDEAYALVSGQNDEYGREAVSALLPLLEDKNTVVILGGYESELKELLKINPGLPSRFGQTLSFESYTSDQRAQILTNTLKENEYEFGQGARTALKEAVKETGDGNARDVMVLMDYIIDAQSDRVSGDSGANASLVMADDIEYGAENYTASANPINPIKYKAA